MTRIRLDAGHGGQDPGAVSEPLLEKDITLEVTKLLAAMLRAHGYAVDLIRVEDRSIDKYERAKMVAVPGVDAVVSIHCNAAADTNAHGLEVFHSAFNDESRELARRIVLAWDDWVHGIGYRIPAYKTKFTKDGLDYYYVVREATKANIPSAYVELGFLTNPQDKAVLGNFWGRFGAAYAVFRGIVDWKEREE